MACGGAHPNKIMRVCRRVLVALLQNIGAHIVEQVVGSRCALAVRAMFDVVCFGGRWWVGGTTVVSKRGRRPRDGVCVAQGNKNDTKNQKKINEQSRKKKREVAGKEEKRNKKSQMPSMSGTAQRSRKKNREGREESSCNCRARRARHTLSSRNQIVPTKGARVFLSVLAWAV